MDTKLKKSHKLTTIIITLCILIPAFFITSLYPRISSAMQQKQKEEYEEYVEEHGHDGVEWEVDAKILNYAMEASYYLYGKVLQDVEEANVDFRVLERYGWIRDFEYVEEDFDYTASYTHELGTEVRTDDDFEDSEISGYITLKFDSNGILSADIRLEEIGNNNLWINNNDDASLHFTAMESVEQYERNVRAYETENNVEIDENQLRPKNFEFKLVLPAEQNNYVWICDYFHVYPEGLMIDVGVIWIMLAGILFVALMAFVLPFFKGLCTGWEKLFCLPLEIIVGLGVGATIGFIAMFCAMGETCMLTEYPSLEIIDIVVC